VTFFAPIFAFLFPTKQGHCHLLRALNQATTTLWEEEVEKDSIFQTDSYFSYGFIAILTYLVD